MRWLVLVLLGALSCVTTAAADTLHEAPKCTNNPCVVTYNLGGVIDDFAAAGAEAVIHDRQVIIDGPCASACVIFADKARSQVCITRRATFGFHKAFEPKDYEWRADGTLAYQGREYFFDMPLSADLTRYVYRQGGFPRDTVLWMKFRDAKLFWRVCGKPLDLRLFLRR